MNLTHDFAAASIVDLFFNKYISTVRDENNPLGLIYTRNLAAVYRSSLPCLNPVEQWNQSLQVLLLLPPETSEVSSLETALA